MRSKKTTSGAGYINAEGKLFLCGLFLLALLIGYFILPVQSLRVTVIVALFLVSTALLYAADQALRSYKLRDQEYSKLKWDMEYAIKTAKERQFTLATKIKELEDSKTATLKIIHDLQLAKEHAEEEKSKDEAMLSSLGEGLIVTDKLGKIQLVNKVFEDLLEWKPREVVGKHILAVIPIQDEKGKLVSLEKSFASVLEKGKKITTGPETSYFYVKKNKARFPVAITITPIIIGKKIVGAVQVFRDITREKEIDQAKSEFVSLASHQLRTPLSTVNWYTEMLIDEDAGKISNEQKQYLKEIYHANRRMVDLVNAFLNVSRIELGTFSVEPEPSSVVKIAKSVVAELKPLISQKRLKMVEKYEKNIPVIQADPKLVRIICQNLLTNAVKYTPTGGRIEIEISLNQKSLVYNENKPESYIRLKVSDNGYGIPQSEQANIFTKLYRADNVKEKDTEGTGLGLYIAKSVLDRVGGMIWFESGENKGTSFYVAIPIIGMKEKKGNKKLE
ncbi:MAG: hypothetical protein A3C85_03740 [Candidatus Doudnabacteria bacterium RIFCSPHIGHO2_02_FULL_48_21]|uniref:histidine kinase n=1 Tax=Candidatus Doudnabacteria bacterium RIFCSPLOWO2_02_FULL_48_13 TaxID=1817845 RepID=A0A1F5QC11_9BACT|nr:MAG: hypothetical protein A3F44_00080 [Candidatus Doudnabacteria bacterium RIFCSPHIGHO2_12_FULL_47_25]OGE93569.1 MAG: hypothetical protein A3C85_03740 [Candidatus Doudnabacteria bacterium RIFCSPHIGHO2_02_FULL_48_21]OGE99688.1 MAG: hypothetical protein A3J05_00660 [Candidatus Doudnabacteria bacterium RIFCSPLOWO2_02_FULL_48_13]OGF01769.1 MAG: hypothetical protein A3G07_01585 [Candidatus Doudnabacteria bacterium RIFCSPLOWO2_12_FULL_47_12]